MVSSSIDASSQPISLDGVSRLKGIETMTLNTMAAQETKSLDGVSRLKGIETSTTRTETSLFPPVWMEFPV